jgi:hypothetical protein
LHRAGEQAGSHSLAAFGSDPLTVILHLHGFPLCRWARRWKRRLCHPDVHVIMTFIDATVNRTKDL